MSVLSPSVPVQPAPPPAMPSAADPDVPTVPIYRLSVEQYHAMIEAGILKSGDPVELLEGWLVQKMTKHPPHCTATRLTRRALDVVVPEGWFVDSQEPLTTTESEPEPDIAVVRGDVRDYATRHPGPQDMALAVEVSDSSLPRDRGIKQRVYARAGIPTYWIVNLMDRVIEVCTDPTGPADEPTYRQRQDFGPDAELPVVVDGREVGRLAVRDLLPRAASHRRDGRWTRRPCDGPCST